MQTIQRTKMRTGLDLEAVTASRATYGSNALPTPRRKGFFRRLLENLSDPIIRVLLIALTLNVVLFFRDVDWLETCGILLAVALSTIVSTISEYGSERAFERLRAQGESHLARVLRGGEAVEIPFDEIVVGDYLLLEGGEMIAADGTLYEGELMVDESSLSGESAEVHKSATDPGARALFRGTIVTTGSGICEVSAVGGKTMYGKMAEELGHDSGDSPLKQRLAHLASQISRLGYVMAAVVALAYFCNAFFISTGFDFAESAKLFANRSYVAEVLLHMISLAITVIVVAVPEGLPMMITVVLTSNMRRMMRDQVLVKKMVGIETAGNMNILFTDKTGTLTAGHMRLKGVIVGGGTLCRSYAALKEMPRILSSLTASAYLNAESIWSAGHAIGGNATDRAILSFFHTSAYAPPEPMRRKPFDSRHKYAATETEEGIYICGATDILFGSVTHYLAEDGKRMPLSGRVRSDTERAYQSRAEEGSRVVLVAIADEWAFEKHLPSLTLVGCLVLQDCIRREARGAVDSLHRGGVQVVMLTGDGKETAVAVATETGILSHIREGSVVSGQELDALADEDVMAILPALRVVYRARPQDKSRLVRLSQKLGLVAGMTGDGVNDAPSLKLADVGFGMGSGTDIAKEAADIVLLDNNISAIERTVLYGRTIFHSIRKFITFQLTMNLCAVGVSLLGQLMGIGSPITILQMLWVNIIMDTLGGLAFAGEAPIPSYMREKPKGRGEPLLSGEMLHQILLTGTFTLALSIWFLLSPAMQGYFGGQDLTYHMSAHFALFIFAGLANCFCARTERLSLFAHLGKNLAFIFIMLLISGVQLLIIYFGGEFFHTRPLTVPQLFSIIGLSLTVIPFDLARKLTRSIRRRK